MKTSIFATCTAFALLLAPRLPSLGPPPATPAQRPKSRLVREVVEPAVLVAGRGAGTVIGVGGRTYVLTAAHVVSHARQPMPLVYIDWAGQEVRLPARRGWLPLQLEARRDKVVSSRTAEVVWYDEGADLALLRPSEGEGLPRATLAEMGYEAEPGEDCWYCGWGSGLRWNLVKSIVNQETDRELIVNGEAWYGHSGSGVFVRRPAGFRLVGVLVRGNNIRSPKTAAECVLLADVRQFLDYFATSQTEAP